MKYPLEKLFALGAIGAVAACQPLPHPFETEHLAPEAALMSLPEVVGIAVDPVRGVPDAPAAALRDNLVKALQDADIPASAGSGGTHSYHIAGDAGASRDLGSTVDVSITWLVTTADGAEVGRDTQHFVVDHANWPGSGTVLASVMQPEALRLAAVLHLPTAAPEGPPPPPPAPMLRVAINEVTGAPGDGNQSLPRALAFALQENGVAIDDPAGTGDPLIRGAVTVKALPAGQEDIKIVWTVLAAGGKSIGTVAQENAVPGGSLDGPWSDAAAAVAMAAADPLRGLVQRAMQPGNITP